MRGWLGGATLLALVCLMLGEAGPESPLATACFVLGLLLLSGCLPVGLLRLVRFLSRGPAFSPPRRPRAGERISVRGYSEALALAALLIGFGLFCLGDMAILLVLPVLGLFSLPVLYYLVSPNEVNQRATLARELAGILRLRLPLGEALEQLAQDGKHRFLTRFRALPVAIYYLSCDVRAGAQLSYALQRQKFFPPFWSAMAMMGERSETLPEVLNLLAQLERERNARPSLLRSLLSLPIIGGATLFLKAYIMPSFRSVTENGDIPVSFAMFNSAAALAWVLLLLPVSWGLIQFVPALAYLRVRLEHLLNRFPGRWPVVAWEQQCLTAFAFWAGARQGRPQGELLQLAGLAVTDPRYQRGLKRARQEVGSSLPGVLNSRPDLFCPEFRWLVRQAVEVEDLPGGLQAAVEYLRERRREAEARFGLGLQLALQFAISSIVLLVALGFWSPLLAIIQSLGGAAW